MFFQADREHFFRPLTGKYREVVAACLKSLYQRLYSPDADYAYHLTREDLRDLFAQALRETPLLAEEFDQDDRDYFRTAKDESAKANEILRLLTDTGWIEKYTDKGSMVTAYRFSKTGKIFSEGLFRFEFRGFKTRQRNVRNTKNALQAYLRDGDPYDLIDAVDFSQQVVSDLSDDISELHERKRQLMKAAVQKIATAVEDFLQYMDQHFVPDLAIRLAADSVERHRHRIRQIIQHIQQWPLEKITRSNDKLCQMTGRQSRADEPLLFRLLDLIHNAVESACLLKSPELRAALDSFINRADLIIKQATALSIGLKESPLAEAMEDLAQLPLQRQDEKLRDAARCLATCRVRLVDPKRVRLRKSVQRKPIETIYQISEPSAEEQRQAVLRDAMDMAFAVSMDQVRHEIEKQMGNNNSLRCSHIIVKDVPSLLALSHAVEIASLSAQDGKVGFTLEATGERFSTPYLEGEDFIIRRIRHE